MGDIMIKVVQERDNIYTVELDVLEISLLTQIALGYSIPKSQALILCVSKGFDTCAMMLKEIAEHETRKRTNTENEG